MLYINTDKLEKINFTKNNFYVVIDFDRTLTSNTSDGSWTVFENPKTFNENFVKSAKKLTAKYYPYELDYNLDIKTKEKYIEEWYYKNINLLYDYNLTYDAFLNCMKNSNLEFRNGAKEFLTFLNSNNIPVIILSAGIGNVIEEFLKANNCFFENIFVESNFIKFKDGKMQKFTDKMIHSLNKSTINLPDNIKNSLKEKEYILLLGDLIDDIGMVSKNDLYKTLTIGFLENKVEENTQFYNDNFDIVFTNNTSFEEVQKLIFNN